MNFTEQESEFITQLLVGLYSGKSYAIKDMTRNIKLYVKRMVENGKCVNFTENGVEMIRASEEFINRVSLLAQYAKGTQHAV